MEKNYQNILIAMDGSESAELALDKAIQVAKRNNAHLLLLHVIDTRAFQTISSFNDEMAAQSLAMAKQTLAEYDTYVKEAGVTSYESRIEYGSPKKIIAHEIPEAEHIDLIMMGATGLSMVERLLVGSVSQYVIRHATCDVLIVKNENKQKSKQNKK